MRLGTQHMPPAEFYTYADNSNLRHEGLAQHGNHQPDHTPWRTCTPTGSGRVVVEEAASAATEAATAANRPLVSYLVRGRTSQGARRRGRRITRYGVPLFDLDAIDPSNMPTSLVEENWCASTMRCR